MWRAALVSLLLVSTPTALPAPSFGLLEPQYLSGTMAPTVLARLEEDWQAYRSNVLEPEHAYCLTRYEVRRSVAGVSIHVSEIARAEEENATPQSLEYTCGLLPALHTHPPSDCLEVEGRWFCAKGEESPMLCMPSDTDVETALRDWHRFSIVQCGPRRFAFYTPRAMIPAP
jgi:hypothetical protein